MSIKQRVDDICSGQMPLPESPCDFMGAEPCCLAGPLSKLSSMETVSGSMSDTRNFNFGIGWLGSDTCGRDTAPTFHHLSAAVLGAVRIAASMSRLGLDTLPLAVGKEYFLEGCGLQDVWTSNSDTGSSLSPITGEEWLVQPLLCTERISPLLCSVRTRVARPAFTGTSRDATVANPRGR